MKMTLVVSVVLAMTLAACGGKNDSKKRDDLPNPVKPIPAPTPQGGEASTTTPGSGRPGSNRPSSPGTTPVPGTRPGANQQEAPAQAPDEPGAITSDGRCTKSTADTLNTLIKAAHAYGESDELNDLKQLVNSCRQLTAALGANSCRVTDAIAGDEMQLSVRDVSSTCEQAEKALAKKSEQPAPSQPVASGALPIEGSNMVIQNASVMEQIRIQDGKTTAAIAIEGRIVPLTDAATYLSAGKTGCFVVYDKYTPKNGDMLAITKAATKPTDDGSMTFTAMSLNTSGSQAIYFGFVCLVQGSTITGEQVRGALNGLISLPGAQTPAPAPAPKPAPAPGASIGTNLPAQGSKIKVVNADSLEKIRMDSKGGLPSFFAANGQLVSQQDVSQMLNAGELLCFVMADQSSKKDDLFTIQVSDVKAGDDGKTTAYFSVGTGNGGTLMAFCMTQKKTIDGAQITAAFKGILEFTK